MNLKQVYEIFYPGKNSTYLSVWDKKPQYRSKKEFFEELIPMEMRWLNIKLWNDKARRSRFWSDSSTENRYTSAVKEFILQSVWSIPRMEGKGKTLLQDQISQEAMNQVFSEIVKKEKIAFSVALRKHLMDVETGSLKQEWGNVLTFLVLFSIFPEEVNQLYTPYLYWKENDMLSLTEERSNPKKDTALFQYEYPPDMSVHTPGELIRHTWIIKNTGEIPWEHRYYECGLPEFPISEENRKIYMPEIVYPGELAAISVQFPAPDIPGAYIMNWKMKNRDGNLVYLDKLGIGLHFTVLDRQVPENQEIEKDNYKVLAESSSTPVTLEAGKMYSHLWLIENTGTSTWKDYYCECVNGESFRYTVNELRIPLKKRVEPGEQLTVKIEFVTPPVEGAYRFIWKIMKSDGSSAFPEERQLEVLLNLI